MISYQEQIDIFNRIQYGIPISRGSNIKSYIQDAKLCEHIITTSNKYKKYFNKYIKNSNNEDHIKYMIEIFLMLERKTRRIKNETIDHELKNMIIKSFDKLDKKYDSLIKTLFSKEMLNNNEFTQKKVIIGILLFAINLFDKEEFDENKFDKNKMITVIDKVYKEINENKKQFTSKELDKYIEEIWNNNKLKVKNNKNIFKPTKNKLTTILYDSSDDNDNLDNDENDDDKDIEQEEK